MKDLVITAFGAVTSVITAIILFTVEQAFGFSFYTWTFWFVIPVGALLSGLAAATGYLLGARLLNHRPGRLLLVSMLGVAVGTFFLVHYLSYLGLTMDGAPLRASVPFGTYLSAVLTHSSISFRFYAAKIGSSGELGAWGYLYALLQILGFAAGGLCVYAYLLDQPFCEACSRYLKRVSRVRRFTDNPDDLKGLVETISPFLKAGRLSETVAAHSLFGVGKATKTHHIRTELVAWRCKGVCTQNLLRFSVAKKDGNDWKDVPELKLEATSHSPVVITEAAA